MSMRRSLFSVAAVGVFCLSAAVGYGQSRDEEAREKPIALAKVPKAARDAAQKVLGVTPTEAKLVSGTNPQEYELEARNSSGREVEVHVLANGTVVKKEIEQEGSDRDE